MDMETVLYTSLLVLGGIFFICLFVHDKLKTITYRLEQQISQNDNIIKVLSEKDK
jgi:hypothetical protein